jgi:hypothetical protein
MEDISENINVDLSGNMLASSTEVGRIVIVDAGRILDNNMDESTETILDGSAE